MKPSALFFGFAALLSIIPRLGLAENSAFPDNLPSFACEIKPLSRTGLKTALANRQRFAQACLACLSNECAIRIWPSCYEDQANLCRNTFCLPKSVKRLAFAEGYNMRYQYRYQVSSDGSASLIDGHYLEGEPRGVTGKRTKAEHLELLNKFLSRASYEPVIIDGEPKSLINLSAIFEIGAD